MIEIIGTAIILLIGVLIWYLKCQTNRMNKREDKRDERDAKREDKMLNIVDVTLKGVEKTVAQDSKNTAQSTIAVKELKTVITNHLVHAMENLTKEIHNLGKKI